VNKKSFLAILALLAIGALILVSVECAADDPVHLLKPDPNCAICQASSSLTIKSSTLIIANLCPQIIYGIELTPITRYFPILVHSLTIRGPPFFTLLADLTDRIMFG